MNDRLCSYLANDLRQNVELTESVGNLLLLLL